MMYPEIHDIVRSKRRSVSLEITSDARLLVRAPNRMRMDQILSILHEKRNWVWKKQTEMRKKKLSRPQKKYRAGERFLFIGKEYPLEIIQESSSPLLLKKSFLLGDKYILNAQQAFEKWYREQAKKILSEKVFLCAERAGVSFGAVKITGAKKRWGSCTSEGNINFSWRLILAPEHIIDYVVAHEVSHLKEMNHSPRFWRVVSHLYPEYKKSKQWLCKNGHKLDL